MYFVLLIHLLQVLHVYSQDIVRLQRTYPKREGPIEIFYQGTWHTICGECWADNAANVACRELGFGGGVKVRHSTRQNITAIQYTCSTGQESRLTSCQLIESCYQCRQAAGVRCSGAVKLVELNPPSTRQVVSVFGSYKGSYIWGHVCGECWTEFNVEATCKGLGYRSGNGSMIKQKKVQSDSNHWNAQYRCKESDADLGSCKIIKTSCSSCDNYAAVECSTEAKVSVDGVWGSWSPYGPCSVTCGGGGYRNRNRTCNNPAPAYGGRECTGNAQQSKLCEEINCPIDGVWGSWSPYGPCSVTCGGGGYRNRNRTCNNPAPAYGGRECTGNAQQSKLCEEINCPIDGVWGSWSPYGPCSVTCGGGGYRNRNRTCNNPAPAYGGRECTGNAQQSKLCEEINCPIDGGWSKWSDFGPCSVTCGQGHQIRTRTCDNPSPKHGGRGCDGEGRDGKACKETECAKTWNKMCSTDSQCAGNLVCKDNTTCYCRHETDVWDPTNLRCQSSSEFLAMYSQEEMDFDSAIEYCAVNMTGFMATQDHINNMFISCMDTNHVTWLSDIRTMTDTNNEEDDVCWTGRVDQNNDILVTNASCMEPRHFVCVINRTNIIPVSEEPACYGFSKTKVTTVKGGIPLGILIAVVATSCVVLLVAAAAIVLNKRKRHTKRKLNSGSQSNPLQITYRHNTTQAAGKMAPQTGYYSECATGGPSEDTNHYSEGTAGSSTDTDNYGYGLLGKTGSRSVRMGEEDMYSHTKPGQPLDDGYDVFVKRKETVDESGVYDHVGNCMIEGEYDSFQGKTIVPVENNYSEYL
ncbi:uncharacterized protein [Argopecten irradians]|uniref:uncharacterized protein isoform X2 n=1 Tax=Argopecten irradians TaxID=31199 RepID=UPI0037162CFF